MPLGDALRRAIPRTTFEEAVALLDWTIKTGRYSVFEVHGLVLSLPRKLHYLEEWFDPKCDSFLESVARTRLREVGHHITSQVPVAEFQAIDLVVDHVVAVELDGREFHADTFERDRVKDLAITLEGRAAMRVSYRMVRDDWPRVEAAISQLVARHRGRGAHRARRARLRGNADGFH